MTNWNKATTKAFRDTRTIDRKDRARLTSTDQWSSKNRIVKMNWSRLSNCRGKSSKNLMNKSNRRIKVYPWSPNSYRELKKKRRVFRNCLNWSYNWFNHLNNNSRNNDKKELCNRANLKIQVKIYKKYSEHCVIYKTPS